ncbi:MAG: hypothetical protein J6A21_03115 [Lentisphaeria bacterium]|nr:hypothetical protein [Lentisphaeria bacterium]
MTEQPEKRWLLPLFAVVILIYFVSESFLRQATVARINPAAVAMDEILAGLPEPIRKKVAFRVTLLQLQNNLNNAGSPGSKAAALQSLAIFHETEKTGEHMPYYREVLTNYRNEPAAYPVYIRFLFEPEGQNEGITVEAFHEYQKKLPVEERFYAWTSAYNKLRNLEDEVSPNADRIARFLEPLSEIPDPPFLEYAPLFTELARFARLSGRIELAEKATKLADQCTYKRSISEFLMQQEEDRKYRDELENRKAGG